MSLECSADGYASYSFGKCDGVKLGLYLLTGVCHLATGSCASYG